MSKKKISVEVLKTMVGVGKQGEIKEVGLSQARNQLIPQGIVKEVVVGAQAGKVPGNDRAVLYENRKSIVEKLNGETLTVSVQTHGSKITGHFDAKDVAQAIKQQYQTKILPEMISFEGVKHPKKIGTYDFHIDIADDAFVRMHLEIVNK